MKSGDDVNKLLGGRPPLNSCHLGSSQPALHPSTSLHTHPHRYPSSRASAVSRPTGRLHPLVSDTWRALLLSPSSIPSPVIHPPPFHLPPSFLPPPSSVAHDGPQIRHLCPVRPPLGLVGPSPPSDRWHAHVRARGRRRPRQGVQRLEHPHRQGGQGRRRGAGRSRPLS